MVKLKSVYLPYDPADGIRYLVETLWPEGVDMHSLLPFVWVRELAPSYYMKETARWKRWTSEKFREEYRKELERPQSSSWLTWLVTQARRKPITLLHNSLKKESQILPTDTPACYLKEFLVAKFNQGTTRQLVCVGSSPYISRASFPLASTSIRKGIQLKEEN